MDEEIIWNYIKAGPPKRGGGELGNRIRLYLFVEWRELGGGRERRNTLYVYSHISISQWQWRGVGCFFQALFAINAIKRIDREGKTDYKSQLCPVNGTELRNRGQKSGTKWAVIFPLSAPCIKTNARHLAPAPRPHRLGLRRRRATLVGDNHDHCVTYAYLMTIVLHAPISWLLCYIRLSHDYCVTYAYLTTHVTPISWLLCYIRLSHDYCVPYAYLTINMLRAPISWLLCYIRLPHDLCCIRLSHDCSVTYALSHDYYVTYTYLMTTVLHAPISWLLCYIRLPTTYVTYDYIMTIVLHTPISWLFCYMRLSHDYYVSYAYLMTIVLHAPISWLTSHTPISWLFCCIRLSHDYYVTYAYLMTIVLHAPVSWLLCYIRLSHDYCVTYAYPTTYVTCAHLMTIVLHTPISWLLCYMRLSHDYYVSYACLMTIVLHAPSSWLTLHTPILWLLCYIRQGVFRCSEYTLHMRHISSNPHSQHSTWAAKGRKRSQNSSASTRRGDEARETEQEIRVRFAKRHASLTRASCR